MIAPVPVHCFSITFCMVTVCCYRFLLFFFTKNLNYGNFYTKHNHHDVDKDFFFKVSDYTATRGHSIFVLVLLRLNVPVNNFFQSCWDGATASSYQYFSGSKRVCAQENNTAEVGIEPPTSRSGVRGSTTSTSRSPWLARRQNTLSGHG